MWRTNRYIRYEETRSKDELRESLGRSLAEVFSVGTVVEVTIATAAFLENMPKPSSDPRRPVWDLMPILYISPYGHGHNGLTHACTETILENTGDFADSLIGVIRGHEFGWKRRYLEWSAAYHATKYPDTSASDITHVLRSVRSVMPWLYVSYARV